MGSKYILVFTCILFTTNSWVSAEETAQEKFTKTVEQAKQAVHNISHALGLPEPETDPEKIKNLFVNQSKIISDQVKDFVAKVQTAANDKNGFIQPYIAQLNQTANSLQSPELQQKTQALQEDFKRSLNNVVEQLGKIGKEFSKETEPNGSVNKAVTNFADNFLAIANNLQKSLQTAYEKSQKEGKH